MLRLAGLFRRGSRLIDRELAAAMIESEVRKGRMAEPAAFSLGLILLRSAAGGWIAYLAWEASGRIGGDFALAGLAASVAVLAATAGWRRP